jgi:hypothetical protein
MAVNALNLYAFVSGLLDFYSQIFIFPIFAIKFKVLKVAKEFSMTKAVVKIN